METVWHMQERQAGKQADAHRCWIESAGHTHQSFFFSRPSFRIVCERERPWLWPREKRETNVPVDCFSEPVDKEDGDGG